MANGQSGRCRPAPLKPHSGASAQRAHPAETKEEQVVLPEISHQITDGHRRELLAEATRQWPGRDGEERVVRAGDRERALRWIRQDRRIRQAWPMLRTSPGSQAGRDTWT
jgi:hypothetical protein